VIEEGRNYGWPDTLGISGNPDFTDPVHVWNEIVAPTGIHFYKGDQFPERYRGRMFQVLFGRTFSDGPDSRAKRIQVVHLEGSGQNTVPSFEDFAVYNFSGTGNPIELAEGPAGSLFLSDIFQGKVFRIRFEN
ncbi:MAG TPA: PQQ-dependent sugar dehydrogenase, partial [Bacteroidales bacterium]|nr:PQQ-dependent sugar dehydrogenase [Bacteroidales bacterium]